MTTDIIGKLNQDLAQYGVAIAGLYYEVLGADLYAFIYHIPFTDGREHDDRDGSQIRI